MAMDNYTTRAKFQRLIDMAAASIGSEWHKAGWTVGSDAAEAAANSTTVLVASGHGVTAKDFVILSTGDEESEPRHAESVTAFAVTLGSALSGTPSAGEEFTYLTPDAVDAAEAGTTSTVVNATGHGVAAGDVVYFVDGGEVGEPRIVASVNANDFTLNAALSGAPTAGEEFGYWTPTSTDAAEAGTTDTIITATAHAASVGDLFVMTSGGEVNEVRVVIAADTDTFTLNEALSGTPSAAETFALTTPTGSDVIEADASSSVLYAEAHSVEVGDVIVMTSGDEDGEAKEVSAVTADSITLSAALTGAPSAAETFNIIRPVALNKVKILRINSGLNQDVHLAYGSSVPTYAEDLIASSGDAAYDLKSNNMHLGADNAFSGVNEHYVWVKEGTTPSSGSLYITILE